MESSQTFNFQKLQLPLEKMALTLNVLRNEHFYTLFKRIRIQTYSLQTKLPPIASSDFSESHFAM